jgi:hypothetical protein
MAAQGRRSPSRHSMAAATPPRPARRPWRWACTALVLVSCGDGGPTRLVVELCRRAPTLIQWNGTITSCSHGASGAGFQVSCRNTRNSMEAVYDSVTAYVDERVVPGRTRVRQQRSGGCGTFAFQGCAGSTLSFEYDAAGRLLRRRWTSSNSFSGEREFQSVTFTAWDVLARPTRGVWAERGLQTDITIAYDDARGAEEWSNGEQRLRDEDANVVREVNVFLGAAGEPVLRTTDYVIEATEPVCTD